MSFKKLTKRLRGEVKANPKRAAVLGLLLVVALWFWAPLVWGWIAPEESAATTVAVAPGSATPPSATMAVPTTATATTTQGTDSPNKEQAPHFSWQELAEWMDNDPRTAAANPWTNSRDPFVTVKSKEPEKPEQTESEEEKPAPPPPPEVTPQSLGLVLSSTIIGARRRVARVSGKSYRTGESIEVLRAGQKIEFRIVEIHPRRIALEREGKQFELTIPTPGRSGRIELVGDRP